MGRGTMIIFATLIIQPFNSMNPNRNIQPDYILRYCIKNTQPVELKDFTDALAALQGEYASFARSKGITGIDTKLHVHKVEHGSIIVDLVEFASVGLIPFAENVVTIVEFARSLQGVMGFLSGRSSELHQELSPNTLDNCSRLVQPIVKDNQGKIEMSVIDSSTNTVFDNCTFTTNHYYANEIQSNATEYKDKLKERTTGQDIYSHCLLRIVQLNTEKSKADKGVIEEISPKELSLVFENSVKEEITQIKEVNPFAILYDVDAIQILSQGRVVAYRILRIHKVVEIEE